MDKTADSATMSTAKSRKPPQGRLYIYSLTGHVFSEEMMEIIRDTAHVKSVELLENVERFANIEVTPNFKILGPRVRGDIVCIKEELKLQPAKRFTKETCVPVCGYCLTQEDVVFRVTPRHIAGGVVLCTDTVVAVYVDW